MTQDGEFNVQDVAVMKDDDEPANAFIAIASTQMPCKGDVVWNEHVKCAETPWTKRIQKENKKLSNVKPHITPKGGFSVTQSWFSPMLARSQMKDTSSTL